MLLLLLYYNAYMSYEVYYHAYIYYLSYIDTMYNNTPATMQGKFTMHRITKIRYVTIVYYSNAILQNPTYRMLRIMI